MKELWAGMSSGGLLTVGEVAELVGVDPRRIYELIDAGQLPAKGMRGQSGGYEPFPAPKAEDSAEYDPIPSTPAQAASAVRAAEKLVEMAAHTVSGQGSG
jgi:excisionase family DNA binding protein